MNENSSFEDDLQAIWLIVKENSRQLFLSSRRLERIEKMLSEVLTELRQHSDCPKNELNK